MDINNPTAREIAAANQNRKEKEYWTQKLSGSLTRSGIPYDHRPPTGEGTGTGNRQNITVTWNNHSHGPLLQNLEKISGNTDQKLHVILTAALAALTVKITGNRDIILGTPIYKQNTNQTTGEQATGEQFINTILPLRLQPPSTATVKELILLTRETMVEAVQHQDYPLNVLLQQLELPIENHQFPLFSTALLLENLQHQEYLEPVDDYLDLVFSFLKTENGLDITVRYRGDCYDADTMHRAVGYLERLLTGALADLEGLVAPLDILSDEERNRLMVEFNDTDAPYPAEKTIQRAFEEQAAKTPDNPAVRDNDSEITYDQLNRRANRLAHLLRKRGVGADDVVGIMMERSVDAVTGLLAILKAGGAYLPIETGLPRERVRYMLENSEAEVLLSKQTALEEIAFTALKDLDSHQGPDVVMTPLRRHIKEFDHLPMPDRSLVNLANYKDKIGMAAVTRSISLQTTRGCPYECLFCHKVWSKKHVFRNADNIYNEVEFYYKKGVRNFSIIDDCFNLNKQNSARFFDLVLKNKLDLQLFFPNGLRGDLLTTDYIDRMVEAGTRGINLSLETASPRLQKLIKKNLDIDQFKNAMDYIAARHPGVILEIATMHGFPTETEEEAMMTLDFIKSIHWLHFPYIHVLKIYPDTEMEELALKYGVSKKDILASRDLAYHELPETLPFPKSFSRKYQSDFLNEYFLSPERLKAVLPVQMQVMNEAAMVQKYNAYLPTEINSLEDILELAGTRVEGMNLEKNTTTTTPDVTKDIFTASYTSPPAAEEKGKKKILLLDLSQHFSHRGMLYNVAEQPLGLISLLTYARQQLGEQITGKIYKAGVDFDDFDRLKQLVEAYQPDLVGIRSLTFYREFFHETVSLLRQWGVTAPIIAGGPYATSDYRSILKDRGVNLVVLGEGEYTLVELLEKMLANGFQLPGEDALREIPGLVFSPVPKEEEGALDIILTDVMDNVIAAEAETNPEPVSTAAHLAYVMYTSGSTGKPKGVMVEHRQVNNCLQWMQDMFPLDPQSVVAQRTNLTFDPSVWEIFWPLSLGARVMVISENQRKDVDYLTRLITVGQGTKEGTETPTVMYCPSTLLTALTHFLEMKPVKPRLAMPWLIIGAEPIAMDVVKTFYSYFSGHIVNTYGPTECTINNTYYRLEADDPRDIVPIGRPVANNRIYIVSPELRLLPVGAAGEICIAGDSVARGYINDRDRTLAAFMRNPFGGGKLYRTGDIGRWLADGNIEIMGRLDHQVKIRGHRIELAEIEAAAQKHAAIQDAVVVAKTTAELKEQVRECKICGIWSNYPGIKVNDEQVCNICENLALYKKLINQYFQTPADFQLKIREGNRTRESEYDCVLVYACERVATYALYTLLDMGFKVMTVTYDSGHYSKESLERIKRITKQIGVDHTFLRHKNSDQILKESLKVAKTMCKGCIHTSSSLAGEYAYRNNIKFVIGETLSRGQIVENKLFKFLDMGIHEVEEIEKEVLKLMRSVASLDKNIYDLIDIDIVKDGSLYDRVEFIDFYRYFNVTNEEMGAYLDEKDSYWKNLENRAVYSTDCKICRVGDFNHFKELGYHYTGSAKSWEKRLGQATIKEVKDDLTLTCTPEEHAEFLRGLGYKEELKIEKEDKHLCLYYVSEAGEEKVDAAGLHAYLGEELPEYMVPVYYVPLEKIPLTHSGKIDRKALPAPDLRRAGMNEYAAPETDTEEKMALVWEEVLGIDGIGVNDELFRLGGDSIKAIRIVSRLQKYHLKLEINDLFLNPTVRKAAQCVTPMEGLRIPEQGPVEGDLPLTPIQHWFFNTHAHQWDHCNHFNQAVVLHRAGGFDQNHVKSVFEKITEHHDALRMVFTRDSEGVVHQVNRGVGDVKPDLEVITVTGDVEAQILEVGRRLQRSIDLAAGPPLKPALIKAGGGQGDYLLIIIHHLVVDGVSWRILLEDFEIGYLQAEKGIDIRFQQKTDSFQYWSQKLAAHAASEDMLKELDYWRNLEQSISENSISSAAPGSGLPRLAVVPPAERKLKDTDRAVLELDTEKTALLLKDVNSAYNTEINDILLTALALAVHRWSGMDRVVVHLEGHGRETIMENVDISRTVGWFTTLFPVLLDLAGSIEGGDEDDDGLGRCIKDVKGALRRVPERGIGYGILRYLTPGENETGTGLGLEPEIIFNYMGQMQEGRGGVSDVFSVSGYSVGDNRHHEMSADAALSINGVVVDGKLVITVAYHTGEFGAEAVDEFTRGYRAELERIIDYCLGVEDGGMTAVDYDAADLDDDEVEAIYDELELD